VEEGGFGVGIEKPDVIMDKSLLVTTVDAAVNWARKNSLWPVTFGLACCALEMIIATSATHDMARFGSEVFRPSPRQADLMIVAGTVTKKMAPIVRRIYEQMPDPKWVIAFGACACSGGIFKTYHVVQGVDQIVPVDVYVPGCPPRPESLIAGLMKLQEKIQKESMFDENRRLVSLPGSGV
jgi:NADH-quinone oxidoreductase subunit B